MQIDRQRLIAVIDKVRNGQGHVGVLGLGVSGLAVSTALLAVGSRISAFEGLSQEAYLAKVDAHSKIAPLKTGGVEIFWGASELPVDINLDLLVVSPGVPPSSKIITAARLGEVPIISELELSLLLSGCSSIIITGSNGKTTTVSLISHLLRSCGVRAALCGNIGTPLISTMTADQVRSGLKQDLDCVVVEASSYQLEGACFLSPNVSGVLNISENHLERHGSLEAYTKAKLQVYAGQENSAFSLVNVDDSKIIEYLGQLKGHRVDISIDRLRCSSSDFVAIEGVSDNGGESLDISIGAVKGRIKLGRSQLAGVHNLYNIAFSVAAVIGQGVTDLLLIEESIGTFSALPHRIEQFAIKNKRFYFNDSKSTSVAAIEAAISAVQKVKPNAGVVVLVGGLRKKSNWGVLWQRLQDSSRYKVFSFGKDGAAIAEDAARHSVKIEYLGMLRELFKGAELIDQINSLAADFEVVLFTPGCASFDEFSGFEERGDLFKNYICGLPD
mgnify:CR=1 FL=1